MSAGHNFIYKKDRKRKRWENCSVLLPPSDRRSAYQFITL